MRPELPIYKRCCVCLPLRYGLIVWAYLKLAMESFVLFGISITFKRHLKWFISKEHRISIITILLMGLTILIVTVDIALSVTFIIGCHKKNTKLIKIFYFYNQFLLVITTIAGLFNFGATIHFLYTYLTKASFIDYFFYGMLDLAFLVTYVAIQGYILLLVRSEIKKLDSGCQFRFSNNAAEADCTLKMKDSNTENDEKNTDRREEGDDFTLEV